MPTVRAPATTGAPVTPSSVTGYGCEDVLSHPPIFPPMNATIRLAALAAIALLTAASTACNEGTVMADPAAPSTKPPVTEQGVAAGTLEATAQRPVLRLRNTTEFVVGYRVMEKDLLTRALPLPCGPECPQVAQGQQVAVPYSSINGYTDAATEAMVMWWTFTRAADGSLQRVGTMQSKSVRL